MPYSHQLSVDQPIINAEILELTDIINQIDLIDTYKTFHPNLIEYTFFSVCNAIFFKIDLIFGDQL